MNGAERELERELGGYTDFLRKRRLTPPRSSFIRDSNTTKMYETEEVNALQLGEGFVARQTTVSSSNVGSIAAKIDHLASEVSFGFLSEEQSSGHLAGPELRPGDRCHKLYPQSAALATWGLRSKGEYLQQG